SIQPLRIEVFAPAEQHMPAAGGGVAKAAGVLHQEYGIDWLSVAQRDQVDLVFRRSATGEGSQEFLARRNKPRKEEAAVFQSGHLDLSGFPASGRDHEQVALRTCDRHE